MKIDENRISRFVEIECNKIHHELSFFIGQQYNLVALSFSIGSGAFLFILKEVFTQPTKAIPPGNLHVYSIINLVLLIIILFIFYSYLVTARWVRILSIYLVVKGETQWEIDWIKHKKYKGGFRTTGSLGFLLLCLFSYSLQIAIKYQTKNLDCTYYIINIIYILLLILVSSYIVHHGLTDKYVNDKVIAQRWINVVHPPKKYKEFLFDLFKIKGNKHD